MKEKRKLLWVDRDPTLYSSNYIGMFDLTKGIFMVEIILSHCINDYLNLLMYDGGDSLAVQLLFSPLTILRYGSVPMLFMICGYGIRRQAIKKNIKNSWKLFIFPYLCVILAVTVFEYAKWCMMGGSLASRMICQVLPFFLGFHPGQHLVGDGIGQIGPVWFFLTYTLASIYLNLILQEKQVWVQAVLLVAGTALALLCVWVPLPFCLQQTAICAGFMYVGMQLKRAKTPQQKLPVIILILVYLLCTFSTRWGGLVEISNNVYGFSGLDLMTAYLAGIVLLCLHQRLNVLQGILADGLRWIGRHMMWLCCVHTVSYLVGPWKWMAAYFADRPLVGLLLEITISFAFALIGCLLLEAAAKKILAFKKRKRA